MFIPFPYFLFHLRPPPPFLFLILSYISNYYCNFLPLPSSVSALLLFSPLSSLHLFVVPFNFSYCFLIFLLSLLFCFRLTLLFLVSLFYPFSCILPSFLLTCLLFPFPSFSCSHLTFSSISVLFFPSFPLAFS